MTTVKKYQVYCTTESKHYTVWDDATPTVCPNNSAHSIDSSATLVVDKVDVNEITVKQEDIPLNSQATGGHFSTTCICLDVPAAVTAGEVTSVNKCFHIPISLLSLHFTTDANMEGDILHADVAPDTIIGTITEDVDIGATCVDIGISVSSTVVGNTALGYFIKLDDGTNSNDLGYVKDIDLVNDIIQVTEETTNSFSASTPTYVKQSVKMLQDFTISGAQTYRLGTDTMSSSYIPTDTIGKFSYENWEMSAKKLYLYFEFFY